MTPETPTQALRTAIGRSSNALLHLHPNPDGDSMGSALASAGMLKQFGVPSTIIRGDSQIPAYFSHFPGSEQIVPVSFSQVDLSGYQLFLCQDCSALDYVTRSPLPPFPPSLVVANIDHHLSNTGFGHINVVNPAAQSTCEIIYDLAREWRVDITPAMAACLYAGIHFDTVWNPHISARTRDIQSRLEEISPQVKTVLKDMTTLDPQEQAYLDLSLRSITSWFGDKVAMIAVTQEQICSLGVAEWDITRAKGEATSQAASLPGIEIATHLVETRLGETRISFRTREPQIDVSGIATELGGGGHRTAAGAGLNLPLDQARVEVLNAIAASGQLSSSRVYAAAPAQLGGAYPARV